MFTITSTVIVPELLVEVLFYSLPQREIKLKANLQAKAVSVSDLVGNPEDCFFSGRGSIIVLSQTT